jgi:thioredoxin 1
MTEAGFAVWNDGNFDAEVLGRPGLALVDFWAEGCVPCRQLERVLTQLSGELPPDVRIGTVRIDDNPALVERFGVRAAPTLLFFRNGALVAGRTGVDRRQVIKKLVETHA